jgi:hypothetical protein
LGYNLVDNVFNFGGGDDNNNNNTSDNNDDGGSLLDNIVNGAKDVVDGVTDKVEDWANDIGNEIADRLAEELGVSEWYSVHVMTACQGDFTPNATAPDAGYNTTNCTGSALGYNINITALIDHDLNIGPAHINLADIGFPDAVQYAINLANDAIKAGAILYVLSVAFTGLGMLLSAATFSFDRNYQPLRRLATVNLIVAVLAIIILLAASLAVTIGARKAVDKINEEGAKYGLTAERGTGFMALTWVAFAFSATAGVFYVVDLARAIRGRK